eukprot:gene13988-15446_t
MIPRNRLLRRRRSGSSEISSHSTSSSVLSRITRFFSSLACCFCKAATMIAPEEQYEDANCINGSLNEDNFIASSVRPRDGISLKTPGKPSNQDDCKIEDVESETGSIIIHAKPALLESSLIDQHDDCDIEKTPSHSDQIEDPKCSSSCDENERMKSKCANNVDQVDGGKDSSSRLKEEIPESESKLRFFNKGRFALPKEDDFDNDYALDISRQVVANVARSFEDVKKVGPQTEEDVSTSLITAEEIISTDNYFYMFLPFGEVTDLQRRSLHLFFQAKDFYAQEDEKEDYYAEIIEEEHDDLELDHIFIKHQRRPFYPRVSREVEEYDSMPDENVKMAPQCPMVQMRCY